MIGMREKSAHQQRIEQFMDLAGQEVPKAPVIPDEDTRLLRANLIFEEMLELFTGMGIRLKARFEGGRLTAEPEIDPGGLPDLVEVLDGCADLSVVTTGTLSAFGVPDGELLRMVDKNNLAKFGPGGHRNKDGKWVKPPGHQPPDIRGLLQRLMAPIKIPHRTPTIWEWEGHDKVRESTGLRDIDGNEVFEGDILLRAMSDGRQRTSIVCWSSRRGAWVAWYRFRDGASSTYDGESFGQDRRIGSYYDDPGLLKELKIPKV